VAPTTVEYWPAVQILHAASPGEILYFPETHSEHVSPLGPVEPALHEQSVETKLPDGELESTAHGTHVEAVCAPTDAEYVPAAHGAHVEGVSAPTAAEYEPAAHGMHIEAPTAAE